MDKQIIIDGVEVNECAYFLYHLGCNSLDSKTCQCINDDCYYKQLKRKEQECEELKENLPNAITRLMGELDQLKAENETYKKMLEDEEVILALDEVRTGERHLWYNKANKLSKTLTEIRDIAMCCIEGDVARIRMKQILQKISECEGNDEN